MNVWTFSGRVGADAELRTTQSGEKVLSFRVANDIGFGERRTTQWVDCSLWGKRGESIANYVKKGDKITVSGEVKLEEFQGKDGSTKAKLAVRVNELDLAARSEGQGAGANGQAASGYDQSIGSKADPSDKYLKPGASKPAPNKPAFDQNLDDEIPF